MNKHEPPPLSPEELERYARLLADLRATGGASLSMLLVIVREMAALERA